MAGIENLRTPTHDEAVERGRKGGLANARNIKKKQTLRSVLMTWQDQEPTAEEKEILLEAGFTEEQTTNISKIALSLIKQAYKGNIKAIELIIKLSGEDQKEQLEIKKLKEENKLLKLKQEILTNPADELQAIEELKALTTLLKISDEEKEEFLKIKDNL